MTGIAGGFPKGSGSESPGPLHAEMPIWWRSIMPTQTDEFPELSCCCGENPLGMPSGTGGFPHGRATQLPEKQSFGL